MYRFFFFVILLCTVTNGMAQPRKVIADKIVGVVGDRMILKSDIDNQIADAKRQEVPLPPNAECFLIQQLVIKIGRAHV